MTANYYDIELLISIIARNCNNADDLPKIINACECLYEALEVPDNISIPPLTVKQLLAKECSENCLK